MSPTSSVPAAEPMEKVAPVGVRNFHSPMTMPRAIPRPRATGLMEDNPRDESPKYVEISFMRPVGPTTRTRSPSCSTRSGVPTMSTSPRRTREIVAPKRLSISSSPTVRPASFGSETVMRRKSRYLRSSMRECDDPWPTALIAWLTASCVPTTVMRSSLKMRSSLVGQVMGPCSPRRRRENLSCPEMVSTILPRSGPSSRSTRMVRLMSGEGVSLSLRR